MKASELLEIFENFIDYRFSPSDYGVIFGCDCGCGGDCYSEEDWDFLHNESDKVKRKLKETLKELNIENDLEDLC